MKIMHQSIPAASSPHADPWVLAFFFVLDGKFLGMGTQLLSCQIPWGGDEKRGQMPHAPLTPQHFSFPNF